MPRPKLGLTWVFFHLKKMYKLNISLFFQEKSLESYSLNPIWAFLGVISLALVWLAPNHAYPWLTFFSDALIGVIFALAIAAAWYSQSGRPAVFGINVLSAVLVAVPLLQYWTGSIHFVGHALVCTLYLCGFLLAQIGAQMVERKYPQRIITLLFTAILLAATISVGLALYQWLGLTQSASEIDIWVLGYDGDRPIANLGQANQLATLLIWGTLAVGFGLWRGVLGRWVAWIVTAWLLTGLALTQSRTGLISLLLVSLFAVVWRPVGRLPRIRWFVASLSAWYALCLWAAYELRGLLLTGAQSSILERSSGAIRLKIWEIFLDASTQHPWFGFGFDQATSAHVAVADRHSSLGSVAAQAHNQLLDFVVWMGWPIGLTFGAALVIWFLVAWRRVREIPDALGMLFISVVFVHSLLEYPLAYAYFLLPVGAMIGVMNVRLQIGKVMKTAGNTVCALLFGLYLSSVALLCMTIYDYVRLEDAFRHIRFQKANIKMHHTATVPEVLILDDIKMKLDFILYTPRANESESVIRNLVAVNVYSPSADSLFKLVTLLELNGHSEEAQIWMRKAPRLLAKALQDVIPAYWAEQQRIFPQLASRDWVKAD